VTGRVRIAPSILSADLVRLAEQVAAVEAAGADWIHVDVMDGRFVPNLTFGAGMIAALRRITSLPLDVHLMVTEPERYIDPFAEAGATVFTFHPEATIHVQRQLCTVRERGMQAGLALDPGTPLALVEDVVGDLDLLLIMSVNPGFSGQEYLPVATDKLRRARRLLDAAGSRAHLEVDGGITQETIGAARAAGADTFVAGSAIFGADDPAAAVRALKRRCHPEV
jgi:ribulose-phosphate 3-epimerase